MDRLPKGFIEALSDHFNQSTIDKVLGGLNEPASTAVRLNSSKPSHRFSDERMVPWSETGRILKQRPNFALDPLFHAGAYYVQDSSSMIIEHILPQIEFGAEGVLALDLCAAPGGKSIILSDFLAGKGYLIANEIDNKRNTILTENLLKWGSAHHAITQLSSNKLGQLKNTFDLVLIDAPCSGEGMFRKDSFAIKQWSEELVDQCVNTQVDIVEEIDPSIKQGGYLIYSTCTMNPRENEARVQQIQELGYEVVDMDMTSFHEWLVPAEVDGHTLGWYLLPGIALGEGLFVSVLRKNGNVVDVNDTEELELESYAVEELNRSFTHQWNKKDFVFGTLDTYKLLSRLPANMAFKSIGVPAYQNKNGFQIPQHGLAMSPNATVDIELSEVHAIDYLRCQSINLDANQTQHWCKVGFENVPLGWVKAIPKRLNNHYPKHYRLRQ